MTKYLAIKLIFIFLLISPSTQAQFLSPKGSLTVDIAIPTAERNIAFSNVLEGLFNGGIGYQYNVYKGLTVGAGAKYSFFVNNRFALNKTVGKGGLHIPAIYGKVGYEKFTTDRFSFNFGLRFGYSDMISINDSTKINLGKPYFEQAFFIEPQLELLLTTEKNDPNGFSLMLGYNFYFSEYSTDFLAREQFIGFLPEWSNGYTRFFSLGFGYRYYFDLY
ncbi:MAG: hypothetical protein ACWA41_01710 [Putridiphycobacter sp.]